MTISQSRVLILILLVAACANQADPITTAPLVTSTVPSTSVATSTTAAPTTTTASSGCGVGDLAEDGEAGVLPSPGSDAEQIGAVTWATTTECERFALDFVTAEGAPATTAPAASAEFLRTSGVFRVYLDVEVTAVTDQLVQSALVDRIYVARRADRSLFVDIHLVEPALGRLVPSGTPGQLLVELEPGGSEYPGRAAFAQNVVVVSPTMGPVEVPLEIAGYSRNFEANTIARVTQEGEVLVEDFTTAADWVETWGEYSLSLEPDGSGPAELFVGEQSAQDGSDRGVLIDIDLP